MLLAPVDVAVPEGAEGTIVEGLEAIAEEVRAAAGGRHRVIAAPADLAGYAASGLPTTTMGRALSEDPLFFAAPLAAGAALRRKG
jgi:hypothetical protein